jgi:hypothetical protein
MTYRKSALAADVLQQPGALPRRLRSLLLMIDGSTPDEGLLATAVQIGLEPNCLEDLAQRGLIERVPGSAPASVEEPSPPVEAPAGRQARLKAALATLAQESLGMRAYMVSARIEAAMSDAEIGAAARYIVDTVRDKVSAGKAKDAQKRVRELGLDLT